jgi:hypothetical protein
MAFLNRHHRNHSWPPLFHLHLIDLNAHKQPAALPDIDEDPFAHFITPITEEDIQEEDPFSAAFSAGIIPSTSPSAAQSHASKTKQIRERVSEKWARYLARHHHDRLASPDAFEKESYLLDDPSYKTVIHEPRRGRSDSLLAEQGIRRPRASRTLSGHRHSWREPSVDIWTVLEEEEDKGEEKSKRDSGVVFEVPEIVISAS